MPPASALFLDLHTHTTASDGLLSPTALVRAAAQAGLAAVAVTDHDTTDGLAEALEAGRETGVTVIPGCEISSSVQYGEMHILGLWTPLHDPELEAALARQRELRHERNQRILERLAALGVPVSMEAVLAHAGAGSAGRPHIAAALVEQGVVSTRAEAFSRFLGKDAPAYAPRRLPEPEKALRLLRRSGAVTVLAHPMLLNAPAPWLENAVRTLKSCGLQAIEAYHGQQSPADTRRCLDMATRFGLAVSGGSDFHGNGRPNIRLGYAKDGARIPFCLLAPLERLRRQS